MSTLQATNLKSAASVSNNIVLDASGNAAFAGNVTASGNVTSTGMVVPSSSFLRNRIINGDMRIDQRNAGASISNVGGGASYAVDRFEFASTSSSRFSLQQNGGAVTPPAGFVNYYGATSTSAYSVTSTDFFLLGQHIEGTNCSDLGWGTANAQTVTLSFWVRSSLTGTFGGVFANSGFTRTYIFTYSISAANTWERKTVTVPGDTTGTWLTTTGRGITVYFSLGAGSSVSGASGAWSGSALYSATGATSVVGTNGATFYLTGVQLEVGTVATPFERRQFGQELALCQRYFERSDQLFQTASNGGLSNSYPTGIYYQVTKRAPATVTIYSGGSLLGTAGSATWYPTGVVGAVNPETNNTTGYMFSRVGINTYTLALFSYTASAEL
jgi:hypothetical protein